MKKELPFWLGLTIIILAAMVAGLVTYWAFANIEKSLGEEQFMTITIPAANTTATSSNSTSDIAGWQTYTNQQYGFSFHYPPNFVVRERENAQGFFSVVIDSPSTQYIGDDTEADQYAQWLGRIVVAPKITSANLAVGFDWPIPIIPDISYFKNLTSTPYLGSITSPDGHIGFQVEDGGLYDFKDTLFQSGDGTWLDIGTVLTQTSTMREPYDGIVGTFQFTRPTINSTSSSMSAEPISYAVSSTLFTVKQQSIPVLDIFKASDLASNASDCGINESEDYYVDLLGRYSIKDLATQYTFHYIGQSQDAFDYVVTVIPNKLGYKNIADFKQDFDICAVGGELYPMMLNASYLLFESTYVQGADDGSGIPHGTDLVGSFVEPTIKFN